MRNRNVGACNEVGFASCNTFDSVSLTLLYTSILPLVNARKGRDSFADDDGDGYGDRVVHSTPLYV